MGRVRAAAARLSGLVGGKARHARALEAARSDFERALAEHERAENERVRQLNDARRSYERTVQGVQTEVREHNTAVDELEADFRLGTPDAVEEVASLQAASPSHADASRGLPRARSPR